MKIKKTTFKRAVFVFCAFSLLLFFWSAQSFFSAEQTDYTHTELIRHYPERVSNEIINIDAAAAISLYWDGEKERVLYQKNTTESLPIASISKIFTALIVYEEYAMDEPIGITDRDMFTVPGLQDLRIWEDTRIGDVLYPLLLESNNSIANALALQEKRFLQNDFIREMNKKAKEMGLSNTHFVNPSGLDERNATNISTARDISEAIKYILKKTDLFSVMSTPSYRVYSYDRSVYYTTINTNQFLFSGNYEWQNRIVGGKTGFTYRALGCLLLVLESPDGEGYIINVVLGANDRFREMERLVNFVHKAYKF